ncbi:hypothetical protein KIK06_22030 [Nocardiopsis sp. EMB25]|uniref:hypothetical protein n=1 Tax=Nocardiopsis sp. EMB25 TaxID=2835867 RepID=UPI00228373F5|nr:hypothetical protein [Nocardiopsis sp. EMB25]MCY9786568.1 hypothetical protein [Nocardiopsis sp. EMB25]
MMRFHRPGLPSDLPPPADLWARGGALAVVCVGCTGGQGECTAADGALVVGGRGDGFRLVLVEGGRAMLLGNDHASSPASGHRRPVDPLGGAPDWLPWDWLGRARRSGADFVYWWDGEWSRVAYPDDWDDDGLAGAVGRFADHEAAVDGIAALVAGLSNGRTGRGVVRDLVRRAEDRIVDAATVAAVLAAVNGADPERALDTARFLGLTGGDVPEVAAGRGGPASGGLPSVGADEWGLLVGDAMRSGAERPRPAPAPAPAATALVDWIRGRVLDGDDACVLVFGALRPWTLVREGGGEPPASSGVPELMLRLREDEADPEHGRWLFLRAAVTRDGAHLERAHDHWPSWGAGHPTGMVADLAGLRAEMAARSHDWRPAWADLLDDQALLSPPWPGPQGRPSVPPLQLGPGGRAALIDDVASLLSGAVAGEWSRLTLTYRALVGYAGGTLTVTGPEGDRRTGPPPGVRPVMAALRSASYAPGRGTWFRVELVLERSSGWRITYDREGEPDFTLPPSALSYALDARYFPRDPVHTPPWLGERLRAARDSGLRGPLG